MILNMYVTIIQKRIKLKKKFFFCNNLKLCTKYIFENFSAFCNNECPLLNISFVYSIYNSIITNIYMILDNIFKLNLRRFVNRICGVWFFLSLVTGIP